MPRALPAILAALSVLSVAACMQDAPGAAPSSGAGLAGAGLAGAGQPTAPPIPVDDRSKGLFEQMTGINGDAVAAVSGDASRSYIYFDLFAARKEAVAAAPARLCAQYGAAPKASYVTNPGDRVPGMKVLVVDCTR